MKVIGLTGGIGTGKSTVSQFLTELGAVIISADEVGHEAFKPGTEAWREIVATFGDRFLTPGGEIDRKKLGELVFGDTEARTQLNRIMHPRMHDMILAHLAELRQQGVRVVVLEAPLLIEAGWVPLVDEVWVTVAPDANVLERLGKRSGLSQAESLARIRSQLTTEERTKQANVIIDTGCSLEELKVRLKELWQRVTREAVH